MPQHMQYRDDVEWEQMGGHPNARPTHIKIKRIANEVWNEIAYDAFGSVRKAEMASDDDYVSVMRDHVRFRIEEENDDNLLYAWNALTFEEKSKLLLAAR